MSEFYNPDASSMNENTLITFLRSPITGDITEVPGISSKNAKILSYGDNEFNKITNTFQLIGVCLQLKQKRNGEYITCKQHCDLFKTYLANKGITNNKDTIVMAIVEKLGTMFPGMYDMYDNEEI